MAAEGRTVTGGGVGVAVGVGVGDGVSDVPGNGIGEALAPAEGCGVTGALVAGGAGGFDCARGIPADASTHPASTTAAASVLRGTKRF